MLLLAQDRGWTIDYNLEAVDQPIVLGVSAAKPGMQFTEAMEGYFSTKVKDDFARCGAAGQSRWFIVALDRHDHLQRY